jgi:hypothetical protein
MERRKILRSLLTLIVGGAAGDVDAHPGRTDSQGCHVCSSNCAKHGLKDGERHCHGKKAGSSKKKRKERKKSASKPRKRRPR